MGTLINPTTVAGPFGAYSQACVFPGGGRWMTVAGQVGVRLDGSLPESVEEQCDWAYHNITAILAAERMQPKDIVRQQVFLLSRDSIGAYRAAREKALGAHKPPTTLLVVQGLANPSWLVEIEVTAVAS